MRDSVKRAAASSAEIRIKRNIQMLEDGGFDDKPSQKRKRATKPKQAAVKANSNAAASLSIQTPPRQKIGAKVDQQRRATNLFHRNVKGDLSPFEAKTLIFNNFKSVKKTRSAALYKQR